MKPSGVNLTKRFAICALGGGAIGAGLAIVSEREPGFGLLVGIVIGALFFVVHGRRKNFFSGGGDGSDDGGGDGGD